MGLPLLWTIDRAPQPKSRERWIVSTRPSALSTVTRVSAQVAPQRCPILCTSVLILSVLQVVCFSLLIINVRGCDVGHFSMLKWDTFRLTKTG